MTTVGILGAGQLGRMIALAGIPLDVRFRFLDHTPDSPASHLAPQIAGDYENPIILADFAAGLDVVTYEFENVPVECARWLAERMPVYPPPPALETAQDRLREKTLFQQLGIPVPPFAAIDSREDLERAAGQVGLPAVLKTRRFGYDGKGQFVLQAPGDIDAAWQALGGRPLLLEGFVAFDREVSVLAARGRNGETAFYPLVENHHAQGILRLSLAPAPGLTDTLQTEAEGIATRVLETLDYVGVLAIELFAQDGRLLANEMAPRVHNSGHWTIEGAETSQFENHLRAVLGLPLGETAPIGHSAMWNLIGTLPDTEAVLTIPHAHLHLYGKSPRSGRKLGHVTLRAENPTVLEACNERIRRLLDTSL